MKRNVVNQEEKKIMIHFVFLFIACSSAEMNTYVTVRFPLEISKLEEGENKHRNNTVITFDNNQQKREREREKKASASESDNV